MDSEDQAGRTAPRDYRAEYDFHCERKRFDLAAIAAEQFVAAMPDSAEAKTLLGLALWRLDRRDDARKAIREAVGLAPESPMTLHAVATTSLQDGRKGEAQGAAQEMLRVAPEYSVSHRTMAKVFAEKENWTEALAAIDRSLALDPEDAIAMQIRSVVLHSLGCRTESRRQLEQAIGTAPDNARLLETRGWHALWANDFEGAAIAFGDALRLNPADESARSGMKSALRGRSPFYRLMLRIVAWLVDRGAAGQAFMAIAPLAIVIGVPRLEPYLPHISTINGFYLPIAIVFAFFLPHLRQLTELHLAFDPVGRTLVNRTSLFAAATTTFLVLAGVAGYIGAAFWPILVEFGSASLLASSVSVQSVHFRPRGRLTVVVASLGLFCAQPMAALAITWLGVPLVTLDNCDAWLSIWNRVLWAVLIAVLIAAMVVKDDESTGVL